MGMKLLGVVAVLRLAAGQENAYLPPPADVASPNDYAHVAPLPEASMPRQPSSAELSQEEPQPTPQKTRGTGKLTGSGASSREPRMRDTSDDSEEKPHRSAAEETHHPGLMPPAEHSSPNRVPPTEGQAQKPHASEKPSDEALDHRSLKPPSAMAMDAGGPTAGSAPSRSGETGISPAQEPIASEDKPTHQSPKPPNAKGTRHEKLPPKKQQQATAAVYANQRVPQKKPSRNRDDGISEESSGARGEKVAESSRIPPGRANPRKKAPTSTTHDYTTGESKAAPPKTPHRPSDRRKRKKRAPSPPTTNLESVYIDEASRDDLEGAQANANSDESELAAAKPPEDLTFARAPDALQRNAPEQVPETEATGSLSVPGNHPEAAADAQQPLPQDQDAERFPAGLEASTRSLGDDRFANENADGEEFEKPSTSVEQLPVEPEPRTRSIELVESSNGSAPGEEGVGSADEGEFESPEQSAPSSVEQLPNEPKASTRSIELEENTRDIDEEGGPEDEYPRHSPSTPSETTFRKILEHTEQPTESDIAPPQAPSDHLPEDGDGESDDNTEDYDTHSQGDGDEDYLGPEDTRSQGDAGEDYDLDTRSQGDVGQDYGGEQEPPEGNKVPTKHPRETQQRHMPPPEEERPSVNSPKSSPEEPQHRTSSGRKESPEEAPKSDDEPSQEYDYEPCEEGEEDCECMDPSEGEYETCQDGDEGCECKPETEQCQEGEANCACEDEEFEYEKCEDGEEDCECYDEDVAPPAYQPASPDSFTPKQRRLAREIVQLINQERIKRNKTEIPASPQLSQLAEIHAGDYFAAEAPASLLDWYGEGKCTSDGCMKAKPRALVNYPGQGYEIAYKSRSTHAADIVHGIFRNLALKRVVLNRKRWRQKVWSHVGAASKDGYTWVWFGVPDRPATSHVSVKNGDASYEYTTNH